MKLRTWARTASFATALTASVALPAAAGTAWNQDRASDLAAELEDAAKRFDDGVRKQPAATPSGGQPDSAERLRDQAQRLERSATSLAAHLDDGEGRAETETLFKGVNADAADAAESARNQLIPQPLMTDWDAVTRALEKLAAYYGPEEQDAAKMPAEALDPQKEQ
jgi:hypothetical protein